MMVLEGIPSPPTGNSVQMPTDGAAAASSPRDNLKPEVGPASAADAEDSRSSDSEDNLKRELEERT